MTSKKKKEKPKPRKPKVNLMAGVPRPKPVSFHGSTQALENACEYPLLGCWIMEDWQAQGITPVVVARQMEENRIIYGTFLVDIYCLGIKNALWKSDVSLKQFEKDLPMLCSGFPEACKVTLAHELIYGAIEYARKYGFEPHLDFSKASLVLDPPDAHPRSHKIEFGKDGKPFFVAGPYDNIESIVNQLKRTAGEGNFNFLILSNSRARCKANFFQVTIVPPDPIPVRRSYAPKNKKFICARSHAIPV